MILNQFLCISFFLNLCFHFSGILNSDFHKSHVLASIAVPSLW